MKMIKMTLMAALAVGGWLACGQVLAQDSAPAGASTNAAPRAMPRNGGIDRLAQMLNLTDDQKAQVKPILDSQREQMAAIFQDSSLSSDDKRSKIKAIRDATSAKLKTILTAEQFQKWTTMQTRMRRMSPGGPGAPRPNLAGTNAPAAAAP